MLERCARLQRDLAKFESVGGENWSETLARYRTLVNASKWGDFVDDYNRLYDELPRVERQLEKELTEAKAKRLRLKLTAATLVASAKTPAERLELEAISKGAGGIYADNFREAQSKIELLVRQRLETPLEVAEPEITADQVALARNLLASSLTEHSKRGSPGFGEPGQVPGSSPPFAQPTDRVIRLSEQLSQLDSDLVSVDDLVARLLELPAKGPAERGLLVDSIEFEVKDRLDLAKRKREIQAAVDDGLAWLTPYQSLTAESLREHLLAAAAGDDLVAVRIAASKARAWAEAQGKRQDGERIRAVLLSELQELGYEINLQGSAWDEGSRITIQKPSEPNYDVQLSAAPDGAIQSKVRAYDHPGRSGGVNRRDVEIEQGWCDDLARVNKQLAERGLSAEILHEDRPGAAAQVPLPPRNERLLDRLGGETRERKA
jgi:hypothetical protein